MAMPVDIPRIATAALAVAPSLLADWLPGGKLRGHEYWPINPVRGDRTPGSFSVNMLTGAWHDFASGDKGGDLVSLLAFLQGCRQGEAARLIAHHLGLETGAAKFPRDARAERQCDALHQEARRQQAAQWERASVRANRLWHCGRPAQSTFGYLQRKGIQPHALRQLNDEVLMVPMYDGEELVALQFITAQGEKRNQKGARQNGCYSPFGCLLAPSELYIVEGIATAATLHESTGQPVMAALSAGNLLPVGRALSARFPNARLIIGGDDDRQREAEGKSNTGKNAALQAAAALDCGYVLPAWPSQAPLHLSDFNDLRQWREGRYE
ncbi:toprim domain-containing protein [Pseudomonas lactis]|uniref:toprim domain-containing protein n=1 Tax=Pseudomonas lactis TaxID=1615674 RepID=UPI001909B4E1|nr:toprim domain-containing protein [Pseudomonas lactis]MBK3446018.1 toprim domain-containing protein [Pseudomonas lactis]